VKRLLCMLVVAVVLVTSAGCGGDKAEYPSDTKNLMPTVPANRAAAPTVPPFQK